jgi:hypothetical protein
LVGGLALGPPAWEWCHWGPGAKGYAPRVTGGQGWHLAHGAVPWQPPPHPPKGHSASMWLWWCGHACMSTTACMVPKSLEGTQGGGRGGASKLGGALLSKPRACCGQWWGPSCKGSLAMVWGSCHQEGLRLGGGGMAQVPKGCHPPTKGAATLQHPKGFRGPKVVQNSPKTPPKGGIHQLKELPGHLQEQPQPPLGVPWGSFGSWEPRHPKRLVCKWPSWWVPWGVAPHLGHVVQGDQRAPCGMPCPSTWLGQVCMAKGAWARLGNGQGMAWVSPHGLRAHSRPFLSSLGSRS